MSLIPYLIGGAILWFFMLKSGVHATIAGVLLAFTIPFSAKEDDADSPSYILEHFLHKPVAFLILPIFALANTGIIIGSGWASELSSAIVSALVSVFSRKAGRYYDYLLYRGSRENLPPASGY